jgi:hypothetical protein
MPEKDDPVHLVGYGTGYLIGIYPENFYPVHVLFDSGRCVMFTSEQFEELKAIRHD